MPPLPRSAKLDKKNSHYPKKTQRAISWPSPSFHGEAAMRVFGLAMLAPTCLVSYFISNGDNSVAIMASIVFYVSATAVYLFPSICVALVDPTPPSRIFIINLLTGWTLIGWCVAYYLALCDPQTQQVEDESREQL